MSDQESSAVVASSGAGRAITLEEWGNSLEWTLQSPMRFLVMDDPTNTWGHGVESFDAIEGAFAMVSAASLSGPVTDRLYQQWTYKHSTLDVVYSSYKHLPGIYVEFAVIWAERRKVLKIEICPPGTNSFVVMMQGAGGPIEHRANGKELPMHQWIWMKAGEGGLAVVQDGAFACDLRRGAAAVDARAIEHLQLPRRLWKVGAHRPATIHGPRGTPNAFAYPSPRQI